jgi:uncharacterized protein (AIM24 family)
MDDYDSSIYDSRPENNSVSETIKANKPPLRDENNQDDLETHRQPEKAYSPKITGSTKDFDFTIHGGDIKFVEIALHQNSSIVFDKEALMCYDDGVQIKTEMNDGDSEKKGILGKVLDIGKATVKGEQVFIPTCFNQSLKTKKAVFSYHFPGKVVAIDLNKLQGGIICRENIFLCASKTVRVGRAAPNQSGATALSMGIKLNKLEGSGVVFLCFGGGVYRRTLADGEVLHASASMMAARQSSVAFKINKRSINGRTMVSESLIGPGEVWIQSAPIGKTRDKIMSNVMSLVKELEKKKEKKK